MNSEFTLGDIFRAVVKNWYLFLLGLAVTFATAVAISVALKPKYRSEALLLLRIGRENLGADPTISLTEKSGVNMVDTRENEINSLTNVMKTRWLVESVVDQLDPQKILAGELNSLKAQLTERMGGWLFPYYALSTRDKAIYQLQNKLRIKALDRSSVIRVSYDADDPLLAQQVVASVVDRYLDLHTRIHRTEGAFEFLSQAVVDAHQKLNQKELELERFRATSGLVAPDEQRAALVSRISKLKSDRMDALAQQASLKAEVVALQDSLKVMPEVELASQVKGSGNSGVDAMRTKLFELKAELEDLSSKYSESHVRIKQLKQAIEETEAIFQSELNSVQQVQTGRSKAFDETSLAIIRKNAELKAVDDRISSLDDSLLLEDKELQKLNEGQIQIARFTREIGILAQNYQNYSLDAERARVDEALESTRLTNVAVSQPASLNYMPVFPIIPLNLALGVVLGVFVGGALALVVEFRSDRRAPHAASERSRMVHHHPREADNAREIAEPATIRHPR